MTNRRKPKNKKKYKKGKKGNDSESSTPQSSTPSVEDEHQQLLQGGACGTIGSRESRSAEKTKRGSERTGPGKESPYRSPGATSSRNTPQFGHSSETDLLIVPDQESGACGPRSPSKRSAINLLKNVFATKKKSPNRSSDPECSCRDKKRHHPECPELTNLVAYAKDKSLEGKSTEMSANESKPPSSNASPIISKKNEDGTQSSSSSDPTVAECFRSASESEQPPEKSFLAIPDQESAGVDPSSPSKKSPLTRLKNVFKSKRRSPKSSSDTEGSCEDKIDHELECPEQRKHEKDAKNKSRKDKSPNLCQIKSEASTSSGSPISKKNKRRGASNVSSESSRRSNSKSSSNSDLNFVEFSCPDKGNRALECSSDNKSSNKSKSKTESSRNPQDYDPQEGTSRVAAIYERNQEHPSGRDDTEMGEDVSEDTTPLIKDDPEEQQSPRRRSKSLKSYLRSVTTRHPSPRRYNLRDFSIQLRPFEWRWLEEIRRPRNANTERVPAADDPGKTKQGPVADADEIERDLLIQLEAVRLVPSVGRHQSLSPVLLRRCDCWGGRKACTHDMACPLFRDLRKRRKRKKCRQDV